MKMVVQKHFMFLTQLKGKKELLTHCEAQPNMLTITLLRNGFLKIYFLKYILR